MKKSAIGIGLLILIALFIFLSREKSKPSASQQASNLKTFRSDFISLSLPESSWACLRAQDQNSCYFWECHDMNGQRADRAFVRWQTRPLTESEKSMDGHYVNLETPMPCGPDLSKIPMTEHTTTMIQGTAWREIRSKSYPNDNYDSRFFVTRESGTAIQVEIAIQLGPYAEESRKKLKPPRPRKR